MEGYEETQRYYDSIVTVALTNMYTLGKNQALVLKKFDRKNPSHICLLHIAEMAHSVFGLDVKLEQNIFERIIFLIFFKKFKWVKRCAKNAARAGIKCEDFIDHIEFANRDKGVFNKIYEAYYKEQK